MLGGRRVVLVLGGFELESVRRLWILRPGR